MIRKRRVLEFDNQSEHLRLLMSECQGSLVRLFEATVDGQQHRWGVLTFTGEELENLERFGDVLFIDGTYSNLRLKWEIIPITAITTDGNLCCCGVFYAALTNEIVLSWLLSELWQLKRDHEVKWQTVITDEGQWVGVFEPREVSHEDLATLVFIAREGGSKDLAYELTTSRCECGLLEFRGMPCSHLLRLHKDFGLEFPRQLIHCRWCHGEPVSDDEESGGDIGNQQMKDNAPTRETIGATVQQRYNLLFGLGKQLASRASRSVELAERYSQGLREMLAEIIDLPPQALEDINERQGEAQRGIIDVVDDVGRPKGRPKGKRLGRK